MRALLTITISFLLLLWFRSMFVSAPPTPRGWFVLSSLVVVLNSPMMLSEAWDTTKEKNEGMFIYFILSALAAFVLLWVQVFIWLK